MLENFKKAKEYIAYGYTVTWRAVKNLIYMKKLKFMKYMKINVYISKTKRSLKQVSFLFIDLKSWLIVPKAQLSARQLFLILKVRKFI